MTQRIQGKRVAILAADGFEESELFQPKEAIEQAGGEAVVVSLKSGEIEANRHREKGKSVAAVSLTQGLIDQAIAFAWPSFGAALAAGLAWPAVRSSTSSA